MNPELLLKFMAQDKPWVFGLRKAASLPDNTAAAPLDELPFFASVGEEGNRFTVIGESLDECLETCLTTIPAIPASVTLGPGFVSAPPPGL